MVGFLVGSLFGSGCGVRWILCVVVLFLVLVVIILVLIGLSMF